MRKFFLIAGLSMSYAISAQKVIDVNTAAPTNGMGQHAFYTVGGVPFVNTKFVNLISGTPYFSDNWMKGKMISTKGQGFSGNMIKLDILNNEIHFISVDDKVFVAAISAKEIWLEDSLTKTKYHLVHSSTVPKPSKAHTTQWYQLLDTGKINLYKAIQKVVTETLPYGASTHEQRIITSALYFISIDNSLQPLKSLKELTTYLPAYKKEVEVFVKNLDTKKTSADEQWIQVVQYYKTLDIK
ncbi:MAG TPA: hypothetical protein VF609_12320 [Flavisolibacter sp.]